MRWLFSFHFMDRVLVCAGCGEPYNPDDRAPGEYEWILLDPLTAAAKRAVHGDDVAKPCAHAVVNKR